MIKRGQRDVGTLARITNITHFHINFALRESTRQLDGVVQHGKRENYR